MENIVGVGVKRVIAGDRDHVAGVQRHLSVVLMMGQIVGAPANQVVQHPHGDAAIAQQIDHMAADETGAAGDDGDRGGGSRHCRCLTPRRCFACA